MGQQTSIFDFRENIVALKSYDVSVSVTNHTFWKTLFLTSMTDDEICAMLNFDDIRELRLFYTDRLAMLVYKCIEQLYDFVHHSTTAMDFCCVDNALRMLGHMLPFLFEDADFALASLDKSKEEKGSARSIVITQKEMDRLASRKQTVFGRNIAQLLFWENMTCAGDSIEACGHVYDWPGVMQHEQLSSKSSASSLGQVLGQTLLKLCFVPGYTLYPTQKSDLQSLRHGLIDRCSLWFGSAPVAAPFTEKAVAFATVAQVTIDRRRVDVLKTIIQLFYSSLCARGRANPFFACLTSSTICPEIPTLCIGLLHGVTHYHSRGILPYTSHVGAELPELILSLSMELLALVDDTVATAVLRSSEAELMMREHQLASFDESSSLAAPPNAWIATLAQQFQDDTDSSRLLSLSLTRILENPIYASSTWLKGSQKVVECQSEALLLLLRLLDMNNFLADFSSTLLSSSIFSLLHIVEAGTKSNQGFNDVQICLYVLLKLSASRGFLFALSEVAVPSGGKIPLASIPIPQAGSPPFTLMDVLVLGLCEMMSPISPRWYMPLIPTSATILANLATGVDKLHETTCFELANAMAFMSHRNVLAKGIGMQQSCQLLVEAAVTMLHRRPRGTVYLLAHLAVDDFGAKLRHVQESAPPIHVHADPCETKGDTREQGEVELVMHDDPNKLSRPELSLPPDFFSAMPLDDLDGLLLKAKTFLEKKSDTTSHVGGGNNGEMMLMEPQLLAMLDSSEFSGELAMPAGRGQLTIRQFHLTAPIAKYVMMQTWRTVHRRNLRPPIFDFSAAKVEFEAMHKYQ